ncbi:MAG: helix-turn-helix domain-containing protein [Clostridia bacterium]|nr:helix-turn-helix domain-containing protein [Clostridia bacterium]
MNAFIKSLMDEHGINQKELAEILGISPSAVSQWKDCLSMNVETLFALSKLFQVTVDELVAEKHAAETPEQKWDRLYNLDGYEWAELVEAEDEESMLRFLEKLYNVNSRFFKLLYKKMIGRATASEMSEFSVLGGYFRPDPWQSVYFFDKHFNSSMNEMEIWITQILNEAIGIENESAIVWELQRIYQNSKIISYEQVRETANYTLFYLWYSALPQERKDSMLTEWYRQKEDNDVLYELIKRGGRILYCDADLPRINFDSDDLDKFEGTIKPLEKLDAVKKVFLGMYGRGGGIPYQQYQEIINKSAMDKVEAEHKFKEKNPIKYWEFMKQWRI